MTTIGYDVIIVGARVAGAATAMLLARQGLRVLAVDRTSFPSDTLSSHRIQLPGVALLQRWGLLDELIAAGTPATRQVRFDPGPVTLDGGYPSFDGVDALYSPRRTVLDALLVKAARAAGAQVREHVAVDDLLWSDGRVTGVRLRERSGRTGTVEDVTARLVIGADGKNSMVARLVGATPYRQRPVQTFGCYSYWSGVSWPEDQPAAAMYQRPGRTVAAFPTNGNLTMVYVAALASELATARPDIGEHHLRTLDSCDDLGERIRAGTRVERLRTAPDLPQQFRKPFGPGWALVGDAGLVLDPISAQGIGNALADAQSLATAVLDGLTGIRPLDTALRAHHLDRDRRVRPMYDLTSRLSRLRPPRADERVLYDWLAAHPTEISGFLGVLAGIVPVTDYFRPARLLRMLGPVGLARLGAARWHDRDAGQQVQAAA